MVEGPEQFLMGNNGQNDNLFKKHRSRDCGCATSLQFRSGQKGLESVWHHSV